MSRHPRRPARLTRAHRAAVVGVLLAAAALRLVALDRIPPGLHFDEAVYGLMAQDILHGARPVFFSAYTGREPLYMYLMAGVFAGIGSTAFAIRLTSAGIGIVTTALTVALGQSLFGRRAGLIAGGLMAVQYWHLTVSRNGYPNILIPPLEALSALFLWRAWRDDGPGRRRWRDWALGGAFAGLVLYTYLAARFWPVLLAVAIVYLAATSPRAFRRRLPGLAVAAIAAGVVAAPLAWHFWQHPADFVERANQVLAWEQLRGRELLDAYARNVRETAGAFVFRGDPRWHYNLPGRPIFSLSVGACFVVGLAVCLRRARDLRFAMPLLWIAVMAVPGLLTLELQPAGQRIFGMFPALVLVPAVGLAWASAWLGRRPVGRPRPKRPSFLALATLLPVLIVVWDGVSTTRAYFLDWAQQPETYDIFNADRARLAELAASDVADARTVVVLSEHYKHPTVSFLAPATIDGAVWADPRLALPLPAPRAVDGAERADVGSDVGSDAGFDTGAGDDIVYYRPTTIAGDDTPAVRWLEAHARWVKRFPSGHVLVTAHDSLPLDIVRYTVPITAAFVAGGTVVSVGDEIAVRAGRDVLVAARDEPLTVPVDWTVTRAASAGRAFALHLRDDQGITWAQSDASGYLAEQWQPGDRVRQWFTLELDPTSPPGDYTAHLIVAGEDGAPLPARLPAGDAASVPVATVRLTPAGERSAAADARPMGELAPGLGLLTYEGGSVRVRPGDVIDAVTEWVRLAGMPPASLAFHLEPPATPGRSDPEPRLIDVRPAAEAYPPTRWQPGEVLAGRYRLTVPPDTPPGQYRLTVASWQPDGAGSAPGTGAASGSGPSVSSVPGTGPDTVPGSGTSSGAGSGTVVGEPYAIASVEVEGVARAFAPPPDARPVQASFGSDVDLVGYSVGGEDAGAGGAREVVLYWRADRTPARGAKVFVHLYGPDGSLVAQHDGVPGGGARPLTGWLASEVVADAHLVPLTAGLRPGTYRLGVGLYDPDTGARWPVTGAAAVHAAAMAVLPQRVVVDEDG